MSASFAKRRPPLWLAALAVIVVSANVVLSGQLIAAWLTIPGSADWDNLVLGGQHMLAGFDPYEGTKYRWSPVIAPLFAVLAPIGGIGWGVLHVAVLPLMRDRWLIAAALIAAPFWLDVDLGNVMAFLLVLAVLAMRGRRWAEYGWLAATLLIPRPLMLPLTVWLLWRRPRLVVVLAVMFAVHGVAVWLSGWGDEWIGRLLFAANEATAWYTVSPTRLIGVWWVPIGLALAAWLTWKGRLGLATVAAQPYWISYYFLMLLLEAPSLLLSWQHSPPGADQGRERGR